MRPGSPHLGTHGHASGPNYVNLFIGYIEEQIFDQFDGPRPDLFGRYIDGT